MAHLWHTRDPPMAHSWQMPNAHQVPDYQSYTTTGHNLDKLLTWTNNGQTLDFNPTFV